MFSETLYTRLPVLGAFTCGLNAVFNLPSINLLGSKLVSAAGLISNVTSLSEYSKAKFVTLNLTVSFSLFMKRTYLAATVFVVSSTAVHSTPLIEVSNVNLFLLVTSVVMFVNSLILSNLIPTY